MHDERSAFTQVISSSNMSCGASVMCYHVIIPFYLESPHTAPYLARNGSDGKPIPLMERWPKWYETDGILYHYSAKEMQAVWNQFYRTSHFLKRNL